MLLLLICLAKKKEKRGNDGVIIISLEAMIELFFQKAEKIMN